MEIGGNPVDSNPLLPPSVQLAVLSTFLLGLVCTVMAVRYARRGEMRTSAVLTIFFLNFLLVIGPVAASLGMIAWHRQRSNHRHLAV